MATGYTRQSSANIQAGLEIKSADLNNEFNAIEAANHNTTGHDHSGSATGTGAKIPLASAVSGTLPIANGGTGRTTVGTNGQTMRSNGSTLVFNDMTISGGTHGSGPFTTTSTSFVHLGLGHTHALTVTNRLLVLVTGQISNNTLSNASTEVRLKYGTGSAPILNAAETGTTIGGNLYVQNSTSHLMSSVPFTLAAIAALVPAIGTTVWIDLVFKVNGGTGTILFPQFNVVEL